MALRCAMCKKVFVGNAGREEIKSGGVLKVWCKKCCNLGQMTPEEHLISHQNTKTRIDVEQSKADTIQVRITSLEAHIRKMEAALRKLQDKKHIHSEKAAGMRGFRNAMLEGVDGKPARCQCGYTSEA